ncbi:MAG: hypothetical protein HYV60_02530 [Planctomycetia bacterium]|nr:hypothetical protein [Planctomycetia bacterium]
MITFQAEHSLEDVTISELLKQIAVTQPYFAFSQIHQSAAGKLVAVVPSREQPMDSECGVRAAAEVGRHLAILGACAAARLQKNEGPHYYLANKAQLRASEAYVQHIMSADGDGDDLASRNLISFADAEFTSNRSAHAVARIAYDGSDADLYRLDVAYSVLSPKIFERFFSSHRVDDDHIDEHAYRDQVHFDDLVQDIVLLDDLLSAHFGFQPTVCAGHFPKFPALPVAVLMYILSKAAGKLLEEVTRIEGVRYIVVEANINAEHLAFPDEKLHLIVQHKVSDTAAGRHGFRCRALAEGRKQHLFGEMFLTLQVVPASVGIRPNGSSPRMPR